MRSPDPTAPPKWLAELLGIPPIHSAGDVPAAAVSASPDGSFALVTARVSDAVSLDAGAFERATINAYDALFAALRDQPARHPVRFWNHIPRIHEAMDARRDRYMVFNSGRFAAFSRQFGGTAQFERTLPTASGVGHGGNDLLIHCLAAKVPGRAVENPRQIPPYHYSKKFGPLPPCFARATMIDAGVAGRPLVLVGGTASIRGEESIHLHDLQSQMRETLLNLARLVGAAGMEGDREASDNLVALRLFREIRVYYPRRSDVAMLELFISREFPQASRVEMICANLCRAELLVEVEGIADVQ